MGTVLFAEENHYKNHELGLKKAQKEPPYDFAPEKVGDVKHSLADISLARELIHYEPVVSFEDDLRKAFEYLGSKD